MNKSHSISLSRLFQKLVLHCCVLAIALPPPAWGMMRGSHVDHDFESPVDYAFKAMFHTEEDGTLSTHPQPPTQGRSQACLTYQGQLEPLRECFEGKDHRVRIPQPDLWPYTIHGQMESRSAEWIPFSGSGVLVGPHHFLTAAHCVYDGRKMHGWARSLTVYLALNDASAPFGAAQGVKAYVYQQWVENEDPDFDMALVILDNSIGNETGWAGMMALPEEELRDRKVHVTGYPGDPDKRNQLWTMEDALDHIDPETFSYKMHTSGGQSGGGIWIKQLASPVVVGVHTMGYVGRNFGVRLSRQKLQDIIGWMEETGIRQGSVAVAMGSSSSSPSHPLAPQEEAEAQFRLGQKHEKSLDGLPQDDREALKCYRIAAQKGHAGAQCAIGYMYQAGRGGLLKNDEEALRFFRLAADQGHAEAQHNMGLMYEAGRGGIAKDEAQAVHWYRQAANQGCSPAIDALRKIEEARRAAEQKRAEEQRKIEEVRKAAEQKRIEEQRRIEVEADYQSWIEEHRRFEEARKAAEQERAEEDRRVEEVRRAQRQAEDNKRIVEEARARPVPAIARGDEDVYSRFLGGILVYRPEEDSDVGLIEMPIAALADPLQGTFDLSLCGDAGRYLSINTGYRQERRRENENKLEIWFTPRFLIEKKLNKCFSVPRHFREIMDAWDEAHAPVGIFWNGGGWRDLTWMDYLTTEDLRSLSSLNLHAACGMATQGARGNQDPLWRKEINGFWSGKFQVSFLNDAEERFRVCSESAVASPSRVPQSASASASSAIQPAINSVDRPLTRPVPAIAKGYEEVCRRFLGGKLIYRPHGYRDDRGMIILPIADLADPLDGTFDLSRCGDTGKYLSISTGYRKGKIPANSGKVEIWFTPWFVADKAKAQVPQNHYLQTVTASNKWNPARAPVGIFWTWGGWDDLKYVDYLTWRDMDGLGSKNLYEAHEEVPLTRYMGEYEAWRRTCNKEEMRRGDSLWRTYFIMSF